MSEFIHYKYKPRNLEFIDYNSNLKIIYINFQNMKIYKILFYMAPITCKNIYKLLLNQYFNNDNTI